MGSVVVVSTVSLTYAVPGAFQWDTAEAQRAVPGDVRAGVSRCLNGGSGSRCPVSLPSCFHGGSRTIERSGWPG